MIKKKINLLQKILNRKILEPNDSKKEIQTLGNHLWLLALIKITRAIGNDDGENWNLIIFYGEHPVMPIPNNQGGTGHDYLLGIFNISSDDNQYVIHGDGLGTYFQDDRQLSYNSREWRGIAEIKLAPNNAPTGQPQIIGKLVSGETLTADISKISDADNFPGLDSYLYLLMEDLI